MKKTITVANLAILLIGVVQGMAGPNVPALKDVFKTDFLIGGALNRSLVTGRDPHAAALANTVRAPVMNANEPTRDSRRLMACPLASDVLSFLRDDTPVRFDVDGGLCPQVHCRLESVRMAFRRSARYGKAGGPSDQKNACPWVT